MIIPKIAPRGHAECVAFFIRRSMFFHNFRSDRAYLSWFLSLTSLSFPWLFFLFAFLEWIWISRHAKDKFSPTEGCLIAALERMTWFLKGRRNGHLKRRIIDCLLPLRRCYFLNRKESPAEHKRGRSAPGRVPGVARLVFAGR